ncbi:regulatory subunit for Cdc7p protein kinase [Cryptococcus neoformans Bt63]|nr:regulatory subunit for Cdc7p protein kinase [Cryptococcus neoformans var. grubii Bt63]
MSVVPSKPETRQQAKTKAAGKDDPKDIFSQWRKGINPMGSKTPVANREVLATLRANVGSHSRQTNGNNTSKPLAKDPGTPESKSFFTADQAKTTNSLEKRPSTNTYALSASKRARINTEREAAVGKTSRAEEEKWTAKWIKVFPSLVFYFEIGAEEGSGKSLKSRVLKMGARVEQFFSTRVTHIIVKGGTTPQKPIKSVNQSRRAADAAKNPFLDGSKSTDLISKAEELQMKVWTVKKLSDILSRIAPVESLTNKDSLTTLLEDERIHGTRERDVTAPRPDYYYFKPGSKYLLIEDATGKHRTIMVKEYSSNHRDGSEWPTLFDSFLRISSSNQTKVPINKLRDRAWKLYAEREPFEGEQPRALKRSASLHNLPSTPRLPDLPDAQPYQDASGNSVVITSNIASTSTPNTPVIAGGLPTLGSNKDRAITQMSKRVQVLKGNARLAAAKRQNQSSSLPLAGTSAPNTIPERRRSMGQVELTKTFLPQEQVIRMLQQTREPIHDPTITVAERIRNREKVEMGLKGREQDTASGYCENCRLKYSDLSVHIASKKHRRFAENDTNFASLDRLLISLQRPLHPSLLDSSFSSCEGLHRKGADCWKCNPLLLEDSEDGMDDEMSDIDTHDILNKAAKLACEVGRREYVDGARESSQSQWDEDEDE